MANKKYYLDENGLKRLSEDLESRHPSTFTGKRAAWSALPEDRKQLYKIINFTDDLNMEDPKHPTVFIGTRDEWTNLTQDEKKKYVLVYLTDDIQGDGWYIANVVEEGNMNPVTSNAVYQTIKEVGDLVIVKNETLSFDSSNIAEYSDDRITSATTAMIYYKDPSIARTSAIASETTTGKIVFTAASAPSSDVVCDIIFIKN